MPGIPQENTPPGAKRECIKARYVMCILKSIEGELINTTHTDFGQVQIIGLHDIVSPESMNRIEKNRQVIYGDWSGVPKEGGCRVLSIVHILLPKPPDAQQSCPSSFLHDNVVQNGRLLVCQS